MLRYGALISLFCVVALVFLGDTVGTTPVLAQEGAPANEDAVEVESAAVEVEVETL